MNVNEIYSSVEDLELRVRALEETIIKLQARISLLEAAVTPPSVK